MKKNLIILSFVLLLGACTLTEFYVEGYIETGEISSITENSAICGGDIGVDNKGKDADVSITAKGIIWSTNELALEIGKAGVGMVEADKREGVFSCKLEGLSSSTRYFVRAFATVKNVYLPEKTSDSQKTIAEETNEVTYYGEIKEFTTTGSREIVAVANNVVDVNTAGAKVNAEITSEGIPPYTERGICVSTSQNPILENSSTFVAEGTGLGRFNVEVTGLSSGTTYYVSAYARNNDMVAYSNVISFKTLLPPSTPEVKTVRTENIKHDRLDVIGEIIKLGDVSVSDHGFCYSETNSTPTVNDARKSLGVRHEVGGFSTTLNDLKKSTNYFIRAYAINNQGISYGEVIIGSTTESTIVVPGGLIAYYTFDGSNCNEAQGKTQYNGVKQGTGTPIFSSDIPGLSGRSLEMNETSFYQVPTSPFKDNLTEWTASLWVKTTSTTTAFFHHQYTAFNPGCFVYQSQIGGYSGGENSYTQNWTARAIFNLNVNTLLLDGSWHLLTITKKSNVLKMYIDGIYYSTVSYSSVGHANNPMYIAKKYTGKMDNFRVYNRELTQSEIVELFNAKQ